MATTGRPPKPIEQKRRTGNPGKRKLPDQATVTVLPGASEPPEPSRVLGEVGTALWRKVWQSGATWLAKNVDNELVLRMCERADEHAQLRFRVLRDNDWRERAALRALDAQLQQDLSMLGFSPVDRARLGVAEVKQKSRLEELMERRSGSANA